MTARRRCEQIVALVEDKGFVSVNDLAKACNVTSVTIRRDLERLDEEGRLRRTHGGAFSVRPQRPSDSGADLGRPPEAPLEHMLTGRINALIATPVDPHFDRSILDRMEQGNIPIIAESMGMSGAQTLVTVDNYQAAMALGQWAGNYAQTHFGGQACVLDLTFQQSNTLARSRGFIAGLQTVLPSAQVVLSINAQSRCEMAHQLTTDALAVHPDINVIFAINDSTAAGAIQACQDRGVAPESLLLLTFGLEGDTLKNALKAGEYCKAGLGMFPEIVGPVCIEAAIAAYQGLDLPTQLITPYAVVTRTTLPEFYSRTDTGWHIRLEAVLSRLQVPLRIDRNAPRAGETLPKRLGFIVPFMEHEWYKSLIVCLQEYAQHLGIHVEVIDADRILRDDVALRQREIAQAAADQVQPGDVLLVDGGQVNTFLAEALALKDNITVITNSMPVFETLRNRPGITLMSTGGALRHSSETLTGPTAEVGLRELRADKLFLTVTGITLNFGLSHTNTAEAAMKQAMIRAAREVILLADHTLFGRDSVMQIGPATAVHKVITDNALPADHRLELGKLGIEVVIARA